MMRWVARAVRVRLGGTSPDAGLSLVELLVTTVLIGLLGAIVGTTFVASTTSLQRSTWRQENTRLAQTGMENVTKAVRAGSVIERSSAVALPAVLEATPTTLELHSFLGTRPMRLRYSVDAQGRLRETRVLADASSVAPYWTFTGASTTRIVIDRVVNSATQPLFVYRDGTGAILGPTPLTEVQRRGVRSVDIALHVQTDAPGRVPPAQVQQRVHLPNLGSIG